MRSHNGHIFGHHLLYTLGDFKSRIGGGVGVGVDTGVSVGVGVGLPL